ncbi:MAG: GlcNAc-PI de-N-acetylase [Lentisphaerae bacterium GWF2_52_8]|nr:MAG: GlcNAc-PI de-N-acetylase [Lentisphaerae bacterium GWF2_52_8]
MKLSSPKADIYVPSGMEEGKALARTTHLCIAAHQDDTEIFAYHGIISCFGKSDKHFSNVTVTDGAGSPRAGLYASYSDQEMQDIRRQEQRKAAMIGEYSIQIQLSYPSSIVKNPAAPDVVDDLCAILTGIEKPLEAVYLHNPADKHDTHVSTMLRAIAALRKLPKNKQPAKVYGCEVWRDLDWLNDDEKQPLATNAAPAVAAALLGVFDSQISGGKRYDLAALGRRVSNATFYASHACDTCDSMTYAMDLTPLVKDPSLSVADYTLAAVERFKNDVKSKLTKLG